MNESVCPFKEKINKTRRGKESDPEVVMAMVNRRLMASFDLKRFPLFARATVNED